MPVVGHCPKCKTSFSVSPGVRFRCVCGAKLRSPGGPLPVELAELEDDGARRADDDYVPGETAGTASTIFALTAIISIPLSFLTPWFLLGVCGGCVLALFVGMCGRGARANFGALVGFIGVFVMVCIAVFMAQVIKDIRAGKMIEKPDLPPPSSIILPAK